MTPPSDANALSGKLDVGQFLRVFPFFCAWDADGVIVGVGPSLRKICPGVRPGGRLQETFRLIRPHGELSPAFFDANPNQLFIIEDRTSRCLLRGGYLSLGEFRVGVLLGTPWMTSSEQIAARGLTFSDFAVHDQTLDLLLLLQTHQMAADDVHQLNARLIKKRERLIEEEARARTLSLVASSTDNAVMLTDAEMRLEWVNEAFVRMTGMTPDQVLGRKLWSLLEEACPEPIAFEDADAAIRRGQVFRAEFRQRRPDGSRYWLSLEAQRLEDDARRVASHMAVGRDVTERKSAEEALRRSETEARRQRDEARRQHDELEWIYNNASVGLCFLDRDLRYRRVNQWLADINGRPVAAHIGRSPTDIAPSDESARLEAAARKVIQTGRPARYEDVTRPSPAQPGVHRYFNESLCPVFNERGEVTGVTLLVQEITDKRGLQLLRETDRRKNEFLAILAHELRNPLAPIKSALQLVQMSSDEDLRTRQQNRAALKVAERQVDHLVRLVDDLLELARITHGKIELRREHTDLACILPQAIDLVRPQLEKKGHRLAYAESPAPLLVFGDKVRLVQVFANLLDNAIKYTPPGGSITLRASAVDGTAVVRVKDDGQGIPREKLLSIWDLFAQVEYASKDSAGGIGIGLALVRTIIELHDGRVGASSQGMGTGAEFSVTIPMTPGASGASLTRSADRSSADSSV